MDVPTIVDWTIRVSQVVIALGIIAGTVIVKPWRYLAMIAADLKTRRSRRRFEPPTTKEERIERTRAANIGISLRGHGRRWFGVGIRNESEYATAYRVTLYLDGILAGRYPTRACKIGVIRRLKPKRSVVRWFRCDKGPRPHQITVTWGNKDGSQGSREQVNSMKGYCPGERLPEE